MKKIDIKLLDRSQWKCYQFEDMTLYYGQVAYLDQKNNIFNPKQQPQLLSQPQTKIVRHGLGLQIYSKKQNYITQYLVTLLHQGNWCKDQKNGYGQFNYQDKSSYKGQFKNDLRSEYGRMQWINGDVYEGNWKIDRFDGPGHFYHNLVIMFDRNANTLEILRTIILSMENTQQIHFSHSSKI